MYKKTSEMKFPTAKKYSNKMPADEPTAKHLVTVLAPTATIRLD
jgi:hypothetical protein